MASSESQSPNGQVSQKRRLLVLSSTYPRWKGDPEPGFVHELSRRLTDYFEVTVLCPGAPSVERRELMDGVQVYRYRYAPESWQTLVNDGGIVTNLKRNTLMWLLVPGFLLAQAWATWRLVGRWKPDVIHAHWLIPQGLVAVLLSQISKKIPPIVVTSHGADLFALKFWPFPALKRYVARRASAMTVVSSAMLDEMRAQAIHSRDVRVESMGVDLQSRFVPDPAVERSRNEILFVGRLVEKKGLRYLIEAMPRILEKHPDAYLTVAGFGPEKLALKQQATRLGIEDSVYFLGAVPQDKLPALYRRAAVFVAPFAQASGGDQEGLGLVTVEAIGCGCPVVVSDLPAVSNVVEDPEMRVPPTDPKSLAVAVNEVLELPKAAHDRKSAEARERLVAKFDWSHVAERYKWTLEAVLSPDLI